MADAQVVADIKAREQSRARRILDAAYSINDTTGTRRGESVIAALHELATCWREEADVWEKSRRKGWQSIQKELRQLAARVAGIAEDVKALKTVEPASDEGPTVHPEPTTDDIKAFLRGDTDTLTTEHGPELTGLPDGAQLIADAAPSTATPELHAEVKVLTEHNPFTSPGAGTYTPVALGPRRSFAELLAPPAADAVPAHWSWSQLETSEDCGLKYRMQRVEQLPQVPQWATIGGNAFHASVAAIETAWDGNGNTGELWNDEFHREIANVSGTTTLAMDQWRASNKGMEGYTWWLVNGADMVQRYIDTPMPGKILTDHDGPFIERSLSMKVDGPYGELEFVGILDQVRQLNDGSLLIVDFKSSRNKPADTFQLGSQGWLLSFVVPVAPVRYKACYYDARKGTYSEINALTSITWDEIVFRLHNAEAKRRAGIYTPRVSSFCGGCSVRYACPAGER